MFMFLIQNIRVGNDIRFSRLLQHMKVRDIQATGGLTKAGFLSLCRMLFKGCCKCVPCMQCSHVCTQLLRANFALFGSAILLHARAEDSFQCRTKVEAWYQISLQSSESKVLSYEALLPIMGILEVQELIEAAVKGGQGVPTHEEHSSLP
jgi:hypothetical protein